MGQKTRKIIYNFRGADSPPVVGSRLGTWCKKITGAAPPTCASVSGGPMELALTSASQAQIVTLYMGDILPFDIDDLIRVSFLAKASAALDASVSAVLGLASAQADDPDAVAANAWFKLAGSNAVVLESDDAVTNTDDIAAGDTLADTYKRLVIDFAEGIHSQSPPASSLGGKSNVLFSLANANNSLRRVGVNQRFDMSGYAGNLQLFAQIQKASGTATGSLSILEAEVEYKLPG